MQTTETARGVIHNPPTTPLRNVLSIDYSDASHMPHLPTLPDRLWYAYHCLPRGADGKPPSYRALERDHDLSNGLLSRLMHGERLAIEHETWKRLHAAMRVAPPWLDYGGPNGPPPPKGLIPLRPGTERRYGDLDDWKAMADAAAKAAPAAPPEVLLAGAEMAVYRPTERLSVELVKSLSWYAWHSSSTEDQARYSSTAARAVVEQRKQRARAARAAK